MKKKSFRIVSLIAFCTVLVIGKPALAKADEISGPGLASGGYIVTVDAENVNINKEHGKEEVLTTAYRGASYSVVEDMGDGWLKIAVENGYGFLPAAGNATIKSVGDQTVEEAAQALAAKNAEVAAIAAEKNAGTRRTNLVNYAMQFVGGPYRYGGNDPRTGADCSGFTRYVMQNGAGVSLNRSSGSQATQGKAVSAAQVRPGDLVFYASGKSINHVAMYIGNGQIVHASTYKTGIKVSNWTYRSPYKIVNVLGD